MQQEEERIFRARGGIAEVFECRASEVLVEGPAGTGKSRGICEDIDLLCETYPGIRVLFCRKTRKSLTESILVQLWEAKTLGQGHPVLRGGASAAHRDSYEYPYAENVVDGRLFRGRSRVVCGGLDNVDRIMSAEYDVIVVFEATEATLDDWEKLTSRLRANVLPWQQAIADCNPASPYHWLNQRAIAGGMHRIRTRHEDNPSVTAEYLAKLDRLTGARRRRLRIGEWAAEEGQCLEEFDPEKHLIPEYSKAPDGYPRKDGHLALDWYFASVDWGFFPDPGVLQVFGVEMWPGIGGEKVVGRLYRVLEIHRLRQRSDWWAEQAVELFERYDLRAVVCDPSEPERIELFNDRLSEYCGRTVGRMARRSGKIARKADNAVKVGIDLMGDMFKAGRILLVRDALRERDEELAEMMRPTCLEEEIPSYVWPKREDGKPNKDVPDPKCDDHSVDSLRYAAMFAWKKDLTPAVDTKPRFDRDSFGSWLGHDAA